MKKQFISCLFCLMTVCLLFTGFTHSLFHSFQNFHFSTKKTEKTIHLKIEKYQIAVIEMEEEDDELLCKIIFQFLQQIHQLFLHYNKLPFKTLLVLNSIFTKTFTMKFLLHFGLKHFKL